MLLPRRSSTRPTLTTAVLPPAPTAEPVVPESPRRTCGSWKSPPRTQLHPLPDPPLASSFAAAAPPETFSPGRPLLPSLLGEYEVGVPYSPPTVMGDPTVKTTLPTSKFPDRDTIDGPHHTCLQGPAPKRVRRSPQSHPKDALSEPGHSPVPRDSPPRPAAVQEAQLHPASHQTYPYSLKFSASGGANGSVVWSAGKRGVLFLPGLRLSAGTDTSLRESRRAETRYTHARLSLCLRGSTQNVAYTLRS